PGTAFAPGQFVPCGQEWWLVSDDAEAVGYTRAYDDSCRPNFDHTPVPAVKMIVPTTTQITAFSGVPGIGQGLPGTNPPAPAPSPGPVVPSYDIAAIPPGAGSAIVISSVWMSARPTFEGPSVGFVPTNTRLAIVEAGSPSPDLVRGPSV